MRLAPLTRAVPLAALGTLASVLLAPAASAAVIVSISPTAAPNAGSPTVTITGSGFNSATDSVTLHPTFASASGAPDITTRPAASTSTATLTFSPALSAVAPGAYDVVVNRGPSAIASCSRCFTVTGSTVPAVSGSAHDSSSSATGALVVSGTGFAQGAFVEFVRQDGSVDPGMSFTPSSYSTTTITGTYSAHVGSTVATAGAHSLRVRNTDGQTGATSPFSQPFLDSVSPATIGQGASNKPVSLLGRGFRSGTSYTVAGSPGTTPGSSKNDVTVGTSTVSTDGTTVTEPVSVDGSAATGAHAISVTTPDGAYPADAAGAPKSVSLNVVASPTVSGVSPSSVGRGAHNVSLTVNGTGFQPGATVSFGKGVTPSAATVTSTSATVTVDVDPTTDLGARDVTVTNPDGGSGTKTGALTITAAPVATSVTPASAQPSDTSKNVVITGTGFTATSTVPGSYGAPGTTVSFLPPDIAAGTISYSASSLGGPVDTLSFTADLSNATKVPHDIVLTNPDGGSSTCTGCFGVDSVAVSPSGFANNGPHALTFTASGLSTGSVATLTHAGSVPDQPTLTSTTTASDGTTATVTFDLTDAAPGPYNATITSSNGTLTCTSCFTVTGGKPTLTSVSPAAAGQGAVDVPVTLTGSGFSRGESVSIAGVTVKNVHYVDNGHVTLTATVPAGTATGAKDVVVTNADGASSTSVTKTGGFTVNAGPVPDSSTTPKQTVGGGAQGAPLTVNGTGFVQGATLELGPGVTATNVTVASGGTSLTATLDVAPTAPLGAHDITVVNPDAGRGTLTGWLTVTAAPAPASISPSVLKPGDGQTVTITGSGFQSGATPTMADVTFSEVTLNADGSLTATAAVATGVAAGARDLVVTNGDHGRGVCTGCFQVVLATALSSGPNGTVASGAAVRLGGRLVRTDTGAGLAGETISLAITPEGSATRTLALTTASDGTWTTVVTATYNTSFVASYAGTAANLPSSAPRRQVNAATKLALVSPRSGGTTPAGSTLYITGVVRPNKPGRTVGLYRSAGSSRVLLAKAVVRSNGSYVFAVRLARGSYNLYSGIGATPGNVGGFSAAIVVHRS